MRKKSSFKTKIKGFDLLGITPHLYFRGSEKKGTYCGVFLTSLVLVFSCICFFYFGQNLYYKKDPNVTSTHQFETFPEKFIINPEKFPLVLEINDPPGQIYFTDDKMFTVTISQYSFVRNNLSGVFDLNITTYPMEKCRASHFSKIQPNLQEYFFSKNLSYYFCVPIGLNNLTMQGSFDQNIYENVKISFGICNNNTHTCLTRDEIFSRMKIGYVGLYFIDSTFDSNGFETPYKETPKEVYTNFFINSQKSINVFFQNNYVESDDGVIFTSIRSNKFVGYSGFQEYNFLTPNDEFFMIYLRNVQEIIHYQRSYSKFQNVLAQIGGFINIFWIFSEILNMFYAKLILIRDIIFDVFSVKSLLNDDTLVEKEKQDLDDKKEEEQTRNDSNLSKKNLNFEIFKLKNGKNNPDNPNLKFSSCDNQNHNYIIPKILEDDNIADVHYSMDFITQDKNSKFSKSKLEEYNEIAELELGLLDYIHYYTGYFKTPERERKKAILLKGTKILKENLDVKQIIQKFYEIEKLKYFLLSEEQLTSFNKISKPELVIIKNRMSERSSVITKVLRKRISLFEPSSNIKTPTWDSSKTDSKKKIFSFFKKYVAKSETKN